MPADLDHALSLVMGVEDGGLSAKEKAANKQFSACSPKHRFCPLIGNYQRYRQLNLDADVNQQLFDHLEWFLVRKSVE